MGKYGGIATRNHGYGKQMNYAGRQTIEERFGRGHESTRGTLADRWKAFCDFAKNQGVKDMRDVTPQLVEQYAQSLTDDEYKSSTAQNYISAVNTVMGQARRGNWEKVSPQQATGLSRTNVRTTPPSTLDKGRVKAATQSLHDNGLPRAAAVVDLARTTGMRLEEAVKANLDRLNREVKKYGQINVQDGTKGGRTAPRWITATPEVRQALQIAKDARPSGSRNLIAKTEKYSQIKNGELNRAYSVLHQHGIKGYHDTRAGYAADRYEQLTGHQAPVVTGQRMTDKNSDRQARETISYELGHGPGRIDVAASYVGGI